MFRLFKKKNAAQPNLVLTELAPEERRFAKQSILFRAKEMEGQIEGLKATVVTLRKNADEHTKTSLNMRLKARETEEKAYFLSRQVEAMRETAAGL